MIVSFLVNIGLMLAKLFYFLILVLGSCFIFFGLDSLAIKTEQRLKLEERFSLSESFLLFLLSFGLVIWFFIRPHFSWNIAVFFLGAFLSLTFSHSLMEKLFLKKNNQLIKGE